MYSNKDKARLKTIEDIVYGKAKRQTLPSLQGRVQELFLTVLGHTRSSKTLKLARTSGVRNRKKCRKNKAKRKKVKTSKKRARKALSADLKCLHSFMDELNQRLRAVETTLAAVVTTLADQETRNREALVAALAEQEKRFIKAMKDQEARFNKSWEDQEVRHKKAMDEREILFREALATEEKKHSESLSAQTGRHRREIKEIQDTLVRQDLEHKACVKRLEAALDQFRKEQQTAITAAVVAERDRLQQVFTDALRNELVKRRNLSCAAQARMFTLWH
jgi:hypothetical protein